MNKFILADNQDITRLGIKWILDKIGESQTENAFRKNELIQKLTLSPDAIVVLDYTNFDFNSCEELAILSQRFDSAFFILFSEDLSLDFLRSITLNNHFSLVSKDSNETEIRLAIQYATEGTRFICNDISNRLLTERKRQSDASNVMLTRQERIMLKEIAAGKTTKEIAAEKNLSFHTVNTHRKNIFRKLGINNVHEATKYAIRSGLIDIAEYYI
ncbi:MAG: response regulator transcription factor [Paludibacteraceae bacterium]|nr:response regulator transcription factor [Paludibacteraceae bacterium]